MFLAIVLVPTATAALVNRGDVALARLWMESDDAHVTVRLYYMDTGRVVSLPLNDYLVGVLAAEMDPNAPMEALKAAAVAARTYTVRALQEHPKEPPTFARQHGADVTDSARIDLPWWSLAEQEERYGANLGVNTVRLQHAVLATDGLILTFHQEPILAFTFGQSVGQTRDGSKVFRKSIPYLKSVACPDDGSAPPRPPIRKSAADLKQALQLGNTSVQLTAFQIVAKDAQGYVTSVRYKDWSWSGEDFAALLGLPSSNFTWSVQNGQLVIVCKGIGSGIGMSLREAAAQARKGQTWQEIVQYFYPGTAVAGDDPFVRRNLGNSHSQVDNAW
jgi:stage II sporulation protein D